MRETEKMLLTKIFAQGGLPVARFELRSSRDAGLVSTALDHVYLTDRADSMELAKERARAFKALQEAGFIALNYRLFVTARADYALYGESAIYASLLGLVREGAGRPGFLFDGAAVVRGRAELTKKGRAYSVLLAN